MLEIPSRDIDRRTKTEADDACQIAECSLAVRWYPTARLIKGGDSYS